MCSIHDTLMFISISLIALGFLGWGYGWYLMLGGGKDDPIPFRRRVTVASIVSSALVLAGCLISAYVGLSCT